MNQTENLPFEISSSNGRLEIRCADVCSRLNSIDAGNLVSALDRTLKADLQPGQRLPLTTSEIELLNFSEFVNVTFTIAGTDGGATKQHHVQLNKQQIPGLISSLRSHIAILRK
jgi:hypothetical protein